MDYAEEREVESAVRTQAMLKQKEMEKESGTVRFVAPRNTVPIEVRRQILAEADAEVEAELNEEAA